MTGNFAVVDQTAVGYATLGPAVTDNPPTSTINFPTGDVAANGITVAPGGRWFAFARVDRSRARRTEFLFDVTGYYVQNLTGFEVLSVEPGRVLDTRNGIGLSGDVQANTAPDARRSKATSGSRPRRSRVTGNLTVVGQTKAGYVALTQTATIAPTTVDAELPCRVTSGRTA